MLGFNPSLLIDFTALIFDIARSSQIYPSSIPSIEAVPREYLCRRDKRTAAVVAMDLLPYIYSIITVSTRSLMNIAWEEPVLRKSSCSFTCPYVYVPIELFLYPSQMVIRRPPCPMSCAYYLLECQRKTTTIFGTIHECK